MVPPARRNTPPDPTFYCLEWQEGLGTLWTPRGSKNKQRTVSTWTTLDRAILSSIYLAKRDPRGATLSICITINFRRFRQTVVFHPSR